MIEKDFRELRPDELQTGAAIWLQGNSFFDTGCVEEFFDTGHIVTPTGTEHRPVCGPFLIERVLFVPHPLGSRFAPSNDPRVDLLNPHTGDRRSMLASWLLVPKEDNNVR